MECTQFTYFQQVGGIDLDPAQRGADLRHRAADHVPAGHRQRLRSGVGARRQLRRRLQGQRGPVVGVQLRAGRHRRCCSGRSSTTSANASGAWSGGWPGRPTTSCSRPPTCSTCSTPAAPSASPSAPATSPGCATWPARWPRPTSPSLGSSGRERRRRPRRPRRGGRRRGEAVAARPARQAKEWISPETAAAAISCWRSGWRRCRPRPAGRPSTCCPSGWPGCSRPRGSTSRRRTSR